MHNTGVEIREQAMGIGSFLPPCGCQGLNSGCQARGWAPSKVLSLPVELSP